MTGSATIHSSKKIQLLDVKLKTQSTSKGTPNTMPNHEKTHLFYVFRVVAATIHRKMVTVQFQTEALCFGHLTVLVLSRDNGGRENI
jgi:hypothetical protein